MGCSQSINKLDTNLIANINSNLNPDVQSNPISNSNNNETKKKNNISNSTLKNKNKNIKFIWMDYNIDNNENKKYKKILKEECSLIECKLSKLIEQGLEEIKKVKFERVILMLSSKMFEDFIPLFEKEKNKISCSLNIIVFTKKDKKLLIEEVCNKNKDISAGYLFDKVNIFDNFRQIEVFIQKEKNRKKELTPHFEIKNIM